MSGLEHSFRSAHRKGKRSGEAPDGSRDQREEELGPAGLTDALGSAVLQDVFVALATEAFVASVRVDAVASTMATWLRLTFINVWTTRDMTLNSENIIYSWKMNMAIGIKNIFLGIVVSLA